MLTEFGPQLQLIASAIGGGGLVKVFDFILARFKARKSAEAKDRELLSADERSFRETVIRQLSECNSLHKQAEKDALAAQREANEWRARVIVMEATIINLEATVSRLEGANVTRQTV